MTVARRFGDPSAPLFRVRPWVAVAAIVGVVLIVVLAVYSAIHAIRFGDAPNKVGTEIGITFALLIVVGSALGWSLYWRALARTFRATHRRHPESLVLGARLPRLDGAVMANSWPPEWQPGFEAQRLVLRIDASGIVVLSTAVTPAALLELTWSQVDGFAPVEYVESRMAYEGLAIEGSPEGSAIVVQLNTPVFLFVRFPRGKALAEIAARANERRPGR